jgi:L-rhamnose isomerase/sugar isomerase
MLEAIMDEKRINLGLELLELEFGASRVKRAIDGVKKFQVEVPSWIFGEFGGGRFGDYMPPGAARTIDEKLDDAAVVNKLTGATDSVAMHVLWDFSDEGASGSYSKAEDVYHAAKDRNLKVGSISPTYFLKGSHRGSFSASEKETVDAYIEQTIFGAQVARDFGTQLLTLWFPDGSMYPGQIELSQAFENLSNALESAWSEIKNKVLTLIEYKVFEPGTYSTTIPDWGSAYMLAKRLGDYAGVLVDLGHHPHATNIEQIVAMLIQDGMRCGFHFNTRYAADDDHSVEPNAEVARIFYELVKGQVVLNKKLEKNWAYMIDQCSSRENRIHAILHSVDSLQISLAKALLVDSDRLQAYQNNDQIILSNRFFNDVLLNADVRPIVGAARLEKLLPLDPIQAFVESGYQNKIEKERK